ncbi:hypothetical protein POM88_030402 [Heracleum sosnowskyi]|uniref:Uncharacterized protein n=1 Tax=Heracleum sosnowskyi TaxID=360622 RepID=A0AAD8MIQ5_9APIA|nr:hypothetical protein POM88_030402 [Heracleum sosnowskyi]
MNGHRIDVRVIDVRVAGKPPTPVVPPGPHAPPVPPYPSQNQGYNGYPTPQMQPGVPPGTTSPGRYLFDLNSSELVNMDGKEESQPRVYDRRRPHQTFRSSSVDSPSLHIS